MSYQYVQMFVYYSDAIETRASSQGSSSRVTPEKYQTSPPAVQDVMAEGPAILEGAP